MKKIKNYIESGMIEAYVMGLLTDDESLEVERYAKEFFIVQQAIDQFSLNFEAYSLLNTVKPAPVIKPMVMASLDYMQRLSDGEIPSFPPLLNPQSVITDYTGWVSRKDLQPVGIIEGIFAKIIGYTPTVVTAIVWLRDLAPQEVHHYEYERFLIVEGTCEITVGEQLHALQPGNFFEIPLHTPHSIKVTSLVNCKVILQRVAALALSFYYLFCRLQVYNLVPKCLILHQTIAQLNSYIHQ